jgi:GntR family transcriptional regulator
MAIELCESFYNGMKKIGFTPEEALAEYKGYISRMEE